MSAHDLATLGRPRAPGWLICLSHLRWNFVFQRPQHIMTRLTNRWRVVFLEEPVETDDDRASLEEREADNGVKILVPHLPHAQMNDAQLNAAAQRSLLDEFMKRHSIRNFTLWYHSPMALAFTDHLRPNATIYDCMDELSAFAGAPPEMGIREQQLLARADLVFTGGRSLYEAKRDLHANVHCVPSSVDASHFRRARSITETPADQNTIAKPRMGFAGVIDERMDLPLLAGVAQARPQWQLVMLGPVVKIDRATLPTLPNIHYLGLKTYQELPAYMAGWDVGLLPFARNAATRFISPTKTPEYLAAGCPVVSTSIRDVIRPFGTERLAHIADSVGDFVAAVEAALASDRSDLRKRADAFLATNSWDQTVAEVARLIDEVTTTPKSAAGKQPMLSAAAV